MSDIGLHGSVAPASLSIMALIRCPAITFSKAILRGSYRSVIRREISYPLSVGVINLSVGLRTAPTLPIPTKTLVSAFTRLYAVVETRAGDGRYKTYSAINLKAFIEFKLY